MRYLPMVWLVAACASTEKTPRVVVPNDPSVHDSGTDHFDTGSTDTAAVIPDTGDTPVAATYESASACKTCHERQYAEWQQSMHSYAAISPVFDAMNAKVTRDTSGDVGTFCTRCHAPLGFAEGEDGTVTAADRSETSREGVTCDVCHSAIHVDGPIGNANLANDFSGLKYGPYESTSTEGHRSERSEFLTSPELCGSCHDVFAYPGIQIEEAYTEYQGSGAQEDGVTCQDCHMSSTPGARAEPEFGPSVSTEGDYPDRPISRHGFVGPDYSLIDAFPYPDDLERSAAAQAEYLTQVEALLTRSVRFWLVGCSRSPEWIQIEIGMESTTSGHNVPTGFTSERQLWVEVTARDSSGAVVFQTGDLDSYGDLRDAHSWAVRSGDVEQDLDLINLQSKNAMFEFDFDELGIPVTSGVLEETTSIFPFEAHSIIKNSLTPNEVRLPPAYRFITPDAVTVEARLRYRNLPPYVLRDLGLSDLVDRLKIFDIDTDSCIVAAE